MNIHLQAHGQKSGPFSLEEVNQQIAGGGVVLAATSAWYEGCADWMPLTHVQGVVVPASMAASIGPPPLYGAQQGDATGGVIPYKNPKALTAYYLGIFGLFPIIGPVLAIPAIILGVLGLKARKLNPAVKGSVHAWIGIVLGLISLLYHGVAIVAIMLN